MNKLIVSVILFILPLSAQANFPWISEEGNGFISVSLVHEKFNDLWEGTNKTSFAPGVYIEQQTLMVAAEYAFIEDYSVDFQTGYTRSTFDSATRGDFKGLYDSNLAVRWRWIDETIEDNLPTVTFRLGVIVAGNYESSSKGNPHSPGDGESGWEGSTILGKMSHDGKIAFYGELGLRQRSGRVPDDVFYNVGLINFYSPSWSFNADVNVVKGLSGTDIKQPGFSPNEFDALKEEVSRYGVGASFTGLGDFSISLNASYVFKGRNTGKSKVIVLSLSQAI